MSQAGRPIAYFSKSLSMLQRKHYSTVEREALAIVEAVRKWQQFVRCFPTIIKTDQKSVSFIFAPHKSKIKNEKLLRWRSEFSEYQNDIQYRPANRNEAADALSRIASVLPDNLANLHDALAPPGCARFWEYVQRLKLPYYLNEVRACINSCKT